MSLDFFTDLLVTGTVLGLDHTSEVAAVEAVLGADCTHDAFYGQLSSFGLIEFGWDVPGPDGRRDVTYFGAQTHRLAGLARENEIETALVDHYGPFPDELFFEDVNAAVSARGFTLEELPPRDDGYVEHWEPTTGMKILWLADPAVWGVDNPVGTVEKMLGGPRSDPWTWHLYRDRRKSFEGYASHLLGLAESDLVAWLDRREPDDAPERTRWWLFLRNSVARRTGGDPETATRWRRLEFTLDRLAAERGIDPPDVAAVALASALRDHPDVEDAPSVDDAVRRWLVTTPPLAEAARLGTDPADIRLARRLRNQIHEIQSSLPLLTSTEVADELRAWVDLKPRLLG